LNFSLIPATALAAEEARVEAAVEEGEEEGGGGAAE
jgi:hypothetical protein